MIVDRKPEIIGMEKYRKYAVTLPLVLKNNQWHLLFEVRAAGLKRQPGEICFPGGKVESGETAEMAAVRETCEELLTIPENICMVQALDVFVSPFDLMVFPYLVKLGNYERTFSSDEVAEVLEIPLGWLETHPPKIYKTRVFNAPEEDFPFDKIPDGKKYRWNQGSYEVAFYSWRDYTIWGLTAAILKGSLKLIRTYLDGYEDCKS